MSFLDENGLSQLLEKLKNRFDQCVSMVYGAEKAGQLLAIGKDGTVQSRDAIDIIPGRAFSYTVCKDSGMTIEEDLTDRTKMYAASMFCMGGSSFSALSFSEPGPTILHYYFRLLEGSNLVEVDMTIDTTTGAATSRVYLNGTQSSFEALEQNFGWSLRLKIWTVEMLY